MAKNTGLGKGFGSLIPTDFDQSILLDKKDRIHKIPLEKIAPNPDQPRKYFEEELINQLSQSIKNHGVLQPLVLTEEGDRYQIVAGERRFRASKKAGLKEVPALIRSSQELEKIEIGLVENVQRVDLSPLEQAVSIARLNQQFNIEIKDVAKRLGKAESTVVNIVRLLQLPENAKKALTEHKISEGHARSILALKNDKAKQDELLRNIIIMGWSVRRAEEFVNQNKSKKTVSNTNKNPKFTHTKESVKLEKRIKSKVSIRPGGKGGKIEIRYSSQTELDRILKELNS